MTTLEQNLPSLLYGLKGTLDTAKKMNVIYNKKMAMEFNPILAFWKMGENKLSEILSFLLNPKQTHGQGPLFLDLFLERLGKVATIPESYVDVDIRCEVSTPERRRIDIHLDFDNGKFGIGIENKIWAKDKRWQLRDYNKTLADKFRGNYCLVYLTPYNRTPDENSLTPDEMKSLLDSKKFVGIDHSSFISNLIEEWIKVCEAEKVKIFLKDLHQYIQQVINRETFMGQNEIIADYVLQENDRLETALEICSTRDFLYETLIKKLKTQIERLSIEKNVELKDFSISDNCDNTNFIFNITEKGKSLWLTYQLQQKKFGDFFYGVQTDGKQHTWLEEELTKHLGESDDKEGQHWAWSKWHEERRWDKQTFVKINNGSFVEEIGKQLDIILPHLRTIINENRNKLWESS